MNLYEYEKAEWFATIIVVVGFAVLFIAFIIGGFVWKSVQCNSKWADFEHRYQIIGGCQVKHNGNWIPADNYREID